MSETDHPMALPIYTSDRDNSMRFKPIQARGDFVPPHLNHSISSKKKKRLGVWSYCFVTFLSMYFTLGKVQFHQSALIYVAMVTMQLFCLFLKTRIAIVFQVST